MQLRAVAAAALIVIDVAGCSSSPPSTPAEQAGALPAGTAVVTIDDTTTITSHAVSCLPIEYWTKITIGDASAGVLITVDSGNQLAAWTVAFNNLGGFTGSYLLDLQGDARVDVVGQTYTVAGTARGFNADNPSFSTEEGFSVKVAC